MSCVCPNSNIHMWKLNRFYRNTIRFINWVRFIAQVSPISLHPERTGIVIIFISQVMPYMLLLMEHSFFIRTLQYSVYKHLNCALESIQWTTFFELIRITKSTFHFKLNWKRCIWSVTCGLIKIFTFAISNKI